MTSSYTFGDFGHVQEGIVLVESEICSKSQSTDKKNESQNHMNSEAPVDSSFKQDLEPPAWPLQAHENELSKLLELVEKDFIPSEEELQKRAHFKADLERDLRNALPDIELRLFGSCVNGFSFCNGDLDICITFETTNWNATKNKAAYCRRRVYQVANILDHCEAYADVQPIAHAKVPIVKVFHRATERYADLSIYNTLALENSRMLKLYSKIDPRVRHLGYILKVFVKLLDIGDASKATLSSYAYILMLLHYLQHCRVPVIPNLQKLVIGDGPKPTVEREGCNVWFQSDMVFIVRDRCFVFRQRAHMLQRRPNRETLAALWLGLLEYYGSEFDAENEVVCVRRSEPLTKKEKGKGWLGQCIAIEDPFNQEHNLGAGLTERMSTYIRDMFANAADVFAYPPPASLLAADQKDDLRNETLLEYYFDRKRIIDSEERPNDRGCWKCGHIGHAATKCPQYSAQQSSNKSINNARPAPLLGRSPQPFAVSNPNYQSDFPSLKGSTPGLIPMKLVPKGVYGPSSSIVTASASDPVVGGASSFSTSSSTRHRNRNRKKNRSRGGSPIASASPIGSLLSAQDSQSSVGSVGSSPSMMPSTAAPTKQSSSTTTQDISGLSELEINETTSAPSSQPDLNNVIIASCNANVNANSSCSIEQQTPDSELSRRDSNTSSSTVANRSYDCRSPTPELSEHSTCADLTRQSSTSGYVSSTSTSKGNPNRNAQSSSYASALSNAESASTAASKASPNSASVSAQTRLQQKPSPISGYESWKPSADWRPRPPPPLLRGVGVADWSPSASAQRPGWSPRWQRAYAAPRPARPPAPSPRSHAHFPTITDGSYPNPR